MKKLVIFLSLSAAFLVSQSASADSRYYGRGFNHWGFNPSYGYNRHFGRGYNRFGSRFYSPYRYGRGDSYFNVTIGNYYGGYGYRRHGFRRYDGRDLIGGIVLGSLISSSFRDYRDYRDYRSYDPVVYRSRPVTTARKVVYVNHSRSSVSSGRKLLRDLEGNCFEISHNEYGDELRTQLDPSFCDY